MIAFSVVELENGKPLGIHTYNSLNEAKHCLFAIAKENGARDVIFGETEYIADDDGYACYVLISK